MNVSVTLPAGRIVQTSVVRSVREQHADQSFPYVLVVGTTGAIAVLGSVLLTVLALA